METSKMKVVNVPVSEIVPYENNPRVNEGAVEQLANIIDKLGFRNPAVLNKDKVIIEGHTRLLAVKKLGWETMPCIIATDLTPEQEQALRIADNKIAEIAEWDEDKLRVELSALQEAGFDLSLLAFGDDELDDLLGGEAGTHGETEPDAVPETPEVPVSTPGEVYVLGNHLLVCGDSTQPNDVAKVCGDGEADLWLTDPPYNVDYHGSDGQSIQNDSMTDTKFREFLRAAFGVAEKRMKPGASFYIFHADSEGYNFRGACFDVGLRVRQCLIWKKQSLVLGRQDYHWIHEPCLYGWKEGEAHSWYSDRSQTTVMEYDKPKKNDVHPCLAPETEVMTENGYVPIGEITRGMKVLSADGRFHEVELVSRHPYAERIFEIKVAGTNIIDKATHNHPYLVAKRSRKGEFDIAWVPAEKVIPGDYLMTPQVAFGTETPVSELDAWCYGLWLAQGSILRSGHGDGLYPLFAIDGDKPELRENLLSWEQSAKVSTYQNGESKGITVAVFNADKGEACVRLCGMHADRKCISPDVFRWTEALRSAFFEGYMAGDGCTISTRGHRHAKSVSKPLATQMRFLAESLGYKASLYYRDAPGGRIGDRKFKKTLPFYSTDFHSENERSFDLRPLEHEGVKYWLRRVKTVSAIPYSGEVVNLSVEGSHTFQTANGMTHNTMKPVEMLCYLIGNSSKRGDIVLDTFGGSGSTLIACERTGRVCRCVELDPKYCDVIRKRWAEFVHGEGSNWQELTPAVAATSPDTQGTSPAPNAEDAHDEGT